ncbi:hypothetical protein [Sphingobacterium endophyticum]|nr:hypothetical protein [Sphingobacterium endophyticum]
MGTKIVAYDKFSIANEDLSKLFLLIAIAFLARHGIIKMGGDLS